jgi:CRISPR-associated protein Csy3
LTGGELSPLFVVRHGIRGTQNVNKADTESNTVRNVSNVQETDSAKKSHVAEAVVAKFSVRFMDLEDALYGTTSKDKENMKIVKDSLFDFIAKAKESEGVEEVSRRYARNILNGRWLWRNRLNAKTLKVSVKSGGEAIVENLDAFNISLNDFEDFTPDELKVAEIISDGLKGIGKPGLEIEAVFDFGIEGEYEVFCSQNYIEDKPSGFARSLYYVGHSDRKTFDSKGIKKLGQAALRDQKISNALRTIDTWYADFGVVQRPIPVEPIGANLSDDCFYRTNKDSAFTLTKKLNTIDPKSPEGMFMIASLIRGGVYSESEKAEKNRGA